MKRTRTAKKGALTFDLYIKAFLESFIVIIVALFLAFLVRQFIIDNLDVREAEARILVHRVYFSPTGISYYDPQLKRSYPGIVDIQKFNETVFNSSLSYESNSVIAANFSLINISNNVSLGMVYYNKLWYDRWKPLSRRVTVKGIEPGFGGPASARSYAQKKLVLVFYNTTKQQVPAWLYSDVVIPNT